MTQVFLFSLSTGFDDKEALPADIVFYNIRTDKWVKQADITPPTNTSTSSTTGSGGSISTGTPDTIIKSNTAAIGGGVAGAVVVVVAIVGYLFIHRRHRLQGETKRDESSDVVVATLPGDTSNSPLSWTHSSLLATSDTSPGPSVEKTHAIRNPPDAH